MYFFSFGLCEIRHRIGNEAAGGFASTLESQCEKLANTDEKLQQKQIKFLKHQLACFPSVASVPGNFKTALETHMVRYE